MLKSFIKNYPLKDLLNIDKVGYIFSSMKVSLIYS